MDPVTSKGLTEQWNGSAWTEVSDLASARQTLNGQGTSTVHLAVEDRHQVVIKLQQKNGLFQV